VKTIKPIFLGVVEQSTISVYLIKKTKKQKCLSRGT